MLTSKLKLLLQTKFKSFKTSKQGLSVYLGPQAKRNVARLQGPCHDITIQGGPLEPTYGAQVVFIGVGGGGGVQGRPQGSHASHTSI